MCASLPRECLKSVSRIAGVFQGYRGLFQCNGLADTELVSRHGWEAEAGKACPTGRKLHSCFAEMIAMCPGTCLFEGSLLSESARFGPFVSSFERGRDCLSGVTLVSFGCFHLPSNLSVLCVRVAHCV